MTKAEDSAGNLQPRVFSWNVKGHGNNMTHQVPVSIPSTPMLHWHIKASCSALVSGMQLAFISVNSPGVYRFYQDINSNARFSGRSKLKPVAHRVLASICPKAIAWKL